MTARSLYPSSQRRPKRRRRLRHVKPFHSAARDTLPGLIHRLVLEFGRWIEPAKRWGEPPDA